MVEQDGDFAATVDARIASVKALRYGSSHR